MLFPQVYFSMSSSSNSHRFLHAAVVKALQVSSTGIYTRQASGETSIQTSVVTMATEFTASEFTTGAIDSL
jgi:beta-lactamase superfamily II metal-dependent hydrolase